MGRDTAGYRIFYFVECDHLSGHEVHDCCGEVEWSIPCTWKAQSILMQKDEQKCLINKYFDLYYISTLSVIFPSSLAHYSSLAQALQI